MTAIAILGRGGMARAHARAWRELGRGDDIRYVSTPRPGPPLEDAPAARFEPDFDRVLRDPFIDIVSICTPTPTHANLAIRALRAGKNVLLEKPIALTLEDALTIRDVAAHSSGILMVAHVVRFFDGYGRMRESVASGALGTVLNARATRISATPGASEWWHDEAKSGGVLVDFAIHDFDQLTLFLGRPVTVSSRRARPDAPFETTVDYEGGGSGQVLSFMGMPPGFTFASSLELLGARGIAEYRFGGALDSVVRKGSDTVRLHTDEGARELSVSPENPYMRQAAYFLDCIESGRDPALCPVDAAITALAVALAARESFVSGRPEPVWVELRALAGSPLAEYRAPASFPWVE